MYLVLVVQALVDGPTTGVPRQALNFNNMSLTDMKIALPPMARSRVLRKRLEKSDVLERWEKSAWAQKLHQRAVRRTLSDFDRFKLKVLKQKVRKVFK